jgi:hypothetical protein
MKAVKQDMERENTGRAWRDCGGNLILWSTGSNLDMDISIFHFQPRRTAYRTPGTQIRRVHGRPALLTYFDDNGGNLKYS